MFYASHLKSLKITLHSGVTDGVAVIRAIRELVDLPLAVAVNIRDSLRDGNSWTPDIRIIKSDPEKCKFLDIAKVDITKREIPSWVPSWVKEYEENQKLLEAGAAGDAEAAIEVCKMIQNGTFLSDYN